jgi:4-methyl-5(b-hydroxyethyl)-thiazole monophosphate biosynthesis
MKRVLCILENGFEEIELVTSVDLLRRAEVEVVMAGYSGIEVTGKNGIRILADSLLEEASADGFDALLLPGGPAVMELRKSSPVLEVILDFHQAKKWIAAICAAPLLLKDAGILDGRKFTAHFSTKEELPESSGGRLEKDDKLLTSRGAGTAIDFGLALVEILKGKEAADEVATAVMV